MEENKRTVLIVNPNQYYNNFGSNNKLYDLLTKAFSEHDLGYKVIKVDKTTSLEESLKKPDNSELSLPSLFDAEEAYNRQFLNLDKACGQQQYKDFYLDKMSRKRFK